MPPLEDDVHAPHGRSLRAERQEGYCVATFRIGPQDDVAEPVATSGGVNVSGGTDQCRVFLEPVPTEDIQWQTWRKVANEGLQATGVPSAADPHWFPEALRVVPMSNGVPAAGLVRDDVAVLVGQPLRIPHQLVNGHW